MRNTMMMGTIAAMSVALVACNQNTASAPPPAPPSTQTASAEPAPGSRNETVSATKDAVNGAAGRIGAELTSSTKGFVEGAAMGDMYEIAASKIALDRSRSKDVKDFAQKMIDAHMKTTDMLKSVLARTGTMVELPVKFDARHQSLIDDLKGAKNEDFDGRFVAQQQNAHDEALTLMHGYAKDGDNPELKDFAAKTQGAVQMHIDMLKSLGDKVNSRQRRADAR